jgi:SAM-dependent methyltransferase
LRHRIDGNRARTLRGTYSRERSLSQDDRDCQGQGDVPDGSIDVVMAHNILHLLEDRERAIADIHRMLKPGGVFVSSTACIGDMMLPLRLIIPVGRFLRLFPLVKIFSVAELKESVENAGFEVDYEWQPKKSAAAFIIWKKVEA